DSGDSGEPAELAGITQLHNDVRAGVGVGPLTWDPALAEVAQAWADQCRDNDPPAGLIDHNDGRSDNYPGYVGENIFGSSGAATAADAVNGWANEVADYDYDSNSCNPGRVCGHYTQVVWANSERLGCALSRCSGLDFGNTIVCNYSPGGNYSGEWPY
ncbi:MAG: CAP domain-containing protein, partial [Myxococcota bacterium]